MYPCVSSSVIGSAAKPAISANSAPWSVTVAGESSSAGAVRRATEMNRDMFDSARAFKRAFVQGLASILETFDPQTELGAFILVVANFCHDQDVRGALGSRLDEALARVLSVYDKQLVEPAGNGD